MEIVQGPLRFSFNYVDALQGSTLFVAGLVYDVTTGTPVFLTRVNMAHTHFGVYLGSYSGVTGKTYLVISAVYTDGTYATPDLNYAPASQEFNCAANQVTFFAFDYTDYGQSPSLHVQVTVYNTTSGSPTFVSNITMVHVALGCYFASFNGTLENTYATTKMVFLDGGFTLPDSQRAAGSDSFQSFPLAEIFNTITAGLVLQGQSSVAVIQGQSLQAILKG